MKLEQFVVDMILSADAKALATHGDTGVHVVPVSTIKVVDGNIWLMNYFMGQTMRNIEVNSAVSLVCWKGLAGYQIKAETLYKTTGDEFDQAKAFVGEILPDRVLKGLLILVPTMVLDVTPTAEKAGIRVG